MKLNIIAPEKIYKTLKEEFPHDNIIVNNFTLAQNENESKEEFDLRYKNKFLAFKLSLIKDYKNVVFINYPNIIPLSGLRREIIQVFKIKDNFIYQDDNLNFFISKKCPSYIKELFEKINLMNNESVLDGYSFFMKPETRQYNFTNIKSFNKLKASIEVFQSKDHIYLINLKQTDFDIKKYKNYLKKDAFMIAYNALDYNADFDLENILVINFDITDLPIRFDILKTYENLTTRVIHKGYFTELRYIKGLI